MAVVRPIIPIPMTRIVGLSDVVTCEAIVEYNSGVAEQTRKATMGVAARDGE